MWNSLRIRFCSERGVTTLLLYLRTSLQIEYASASVVLLSFSFFFIFTINLSSNTLFFIASNVMSSFHTVLHSIFLISTSACTEAMTVSSKVSLFFVISLDNPSA